MKMLYIDWMITAYYLGIAATGDYNYRRKLQTLARNEFAKWRRYKHFNRKLKFLK